MLKKIRIQNLAIIEDIEIEFNSNFTALTGATGAGKSLVIDSLKLIFGKRADSDYIRHGEDEAIVSAYFSNLNEHVIAYLKTLGIQSDELIIERWISRKDRNKILVNNKQSSLQDLRELGLLIGDIHEQHDTTKLLDPNTALQMIDDFGKTNTLLNDYVVARHLYLEAKNKYENAVKKTEQNIEKLDEYKYQYNELIKANLESEELSLLEQQITALTNQKEIIESLNKAYLSLKQIEDESLLYGGFQALEKIKDIALEYQEHYQRIESSYYELSDVKDGLYDALDKIKETSVYELESLQERYYFLKDLEKKYHKDIKDLIDYTYSLEDEILKIENFDAFLEKLNEQQLSLYQKAYEKGKKLSDKRKQVAYRLEKEFIEILKQLDISYVEFKVLFEDFKGTLLEDGIDQVLFLISLNEGEPLKPFYKVASGGELSRSMLALKILYGRINMLSLMVFDEIDLGISGDAASKVAGALKELSNEIQIITITHLPQVAAIATDHFNIEKGILKGRTITVIKDLDEEERIYHLAYMLSGKVLTEGSILHAKSLLDNKKSPKA